MDVRGQGELQKEINGNLKTRVRHARDTHVEVNKAKLTPSLLQTLQIPSICQHTRTENMLSMPGEEFVSQRYKNFPAELPSVRSFMHIASKGVR
jgi:hypothetical protein